MGATGSIVQHGAGCIKAEETSLMKLYNRQRRRDQHGSYNRAAMEQAQEDTIGLQGGLVGLLNNNNAHSKWLSKTNTTDMWRAQLATDILRDRDTPFRASLCHDEDNVPVKFSAAKTVVESKGRANSDVDLRRLARARTRDNALIQVYNNNSRGHRHYADLCSSLSSLQRLLHGSSAERTGWATIRSVSTALAEIGVVAIADDAVLLLADQQQEEPTHLGRLCAKARSENGTPEIDTRTLVYWPTIVRFLEEGPSTEREDYEDIKIPSKRPIIPRPSEEKPSTAGGESQSDKSAKTQIGRDDNDRPAGCRAETEPFFEETPAEETDPLSTEYEPILQSTPANGTCPRSCMDDRARGVVGVDVGGMDSVTGVEQGLHGVEDDLRATFQNQLSPRWVADTMEKIREVLASAGAHCECQKGLEDTTGIQDRTATGGAKDKARRGCRQKKTSHIDVVGGNENKSCDLVSDGSASSSRCQNSLLDEEALASAASAAGKKGDVAALNVLAGIVDLRKNDAFGRNALYYACLCGHVAAAHFVAIRAYGGVQGIPEQERWECRKNALTAEMRHYLDTGVSPPRPEPPPCHSVERHRGEPTHCHEQRNQHQEVTTTTTCCCSNNGGKGDQGQYCQEGGAKSCGGGNAMAETGHMPSSPPEDAEFSISRLFDVKGSRGMGDY